MEMKVCRSRLRAFWRRRLLHLRDRIDSRLERLEEKKRSLEETPAGEAEPSARARRRPARRGRSRREPATPAAPPVES